MMRIILYTGKGGVGKTSIAAATAIKLAESGKNVLVMSTDQAHSLADSLEVKLYNEPTKVCENLDAIEVDVVAESERAWGSLRGFMKDVITSRTQDGIEAEELLVFPGLEELFSLFKILDMYDLGCYDVIIVDCAPTGETLSLLKYPEMFGRMIEKVMPMKRKMVKVAGPVVTKVTKIPMPKDTVFDDIERLMHKLERLQNLMLDKEMVSLRIVTTPERIVIKETKRNFTWLQLYDYNVDAVIVNKVYPSEALEGYFSQWIKLQEQGLTELRESFTDIPLFSLELQKQELKSLEILSKMGMLYGKEDPYQVFVSRKIFDLFQQGENHRLEIYLPFADKKEMDLSQSNGEIHLSIKNEKRCFALPDAVKGKDIIGAKLEAGVLAIEFAKLF